ncbi:MAG: hypothetical protein Kow00117_13950 [Phototrophicales bacterium]
MRSKRLTFLFLAFYFVFLGGSAYYTLLLPLRIFHHVFVSILMIYWLISRIRHEGLPRTPLDPAIFAAFGVWGITAITSIDPRMSFEMLWFVLLHVFLFYVLVDFFQRGRHRLVMETTFILSALVVIITMIELASWYFGLGIIPGTEVGWFNIKPIPPEMLRVSLAMNISTLLAGFVAPLIITTFAWGITSKRKDYRRVLIALSLSLLIVLILTFSRGGLMSFGVSAAIFGGLQIIRRQTYPRWLIGVGLALGLGLFGIVFTMSATRSSGDAGRLDMYQSAIEMWIDHPITGVGPGVYGRALRQYRTPEQARDKLASAHNAPLNTVAETGLLGLIITVWLGVLVVHAWRKTWQKQPWYGQKIRLEATIAAFIGMCVHSMVDVFTVTPVVLVLLLLVAYSITGQRSSLDILPPGRKTPAWIGLIIVLCYAGFLLQADRAQLAYQASLNGIDPLKNAQRAESIDPHLNLYDLQIAYLENTIESYQSALILEPTWDVGWMNLAALYEAQDDLSAAYDAVQTAVNIMPLRGYQLHLARLAESGELADETTIIAWYINGMRYSTEALNRLPLAAFWIETPLRRAALESYLETLPVDLAYRVRTAHGYPTSRPTVPTSAADYWVEGETATTPQDAIVAFTEAIRLDDNNGDYYASRARAYIAAGNIQTAKRDLTLARLYGTRFEYPNAIEATITDDPRSREALIRQALPGRVIPAEFAAVLYGGRPATFDLLPAMRPIGPGKDALQPWFDLAQAYRRIGNEAEAMRILQAIQDYAPDQDLDDFGISN